MRKAKALISLLLSLSVALTTGVNIKASAGQEGTVAGESTLSVPPQTIYKKNEFRAVWMSTAFNKDWPAIGGGFSAAQQRADYISKLEALKDIGMNALIFQVRPMGDAFYPSAYAPWSSYLAGSLGTSPGYDPLKFALEEAAKRNMEFHAWFNPFRISSDRNFNITEYLNRLPDTSPLKANPQWIVRYEGGESVLHWINPGIPEAREYLIETVLEVVKNYDVDGIHLDDYFYPYPIAGVEFPDENEYQLLGTGFSNKGDWRRENVNSFVSELSKRIKAEKSHVRFGISPFGIWKNGIASGGSETNGLSSFDSLYCDSLKWVNSSWIDYIIPQIYWNFGFTPAAYEKLIDWWTKQVRGKNISLYIGHAAYKAAEDSNNEPWRNVEEIPNQIKYNREFEEIKGSSFFSVRDVLFNSLNLKDRLKEDIYKYPALIPPMPWKDNIKPAAPGITGLQKTASGLELQWSDNSKGEAQYFVVYRFAGEEQVDFTDSSKIAAVVTGGSTGYKYVDNEVNSVDKYRYSVTAVDRSHNESTASGIISNKEVSLTAITTDKPSPQKSYSVINVTANSMGSPEALYRFSMFNGSSWRVVRGYAAERTFPWFEVKPGNYKIRVDAKVPDSKLDFDSRLELDYRIDGLYKLFIDPGHGGRDPGAIGVSGVYEKDLCLSISHKLKVEFANYGIEIMMSREDDRTLTLSERAEMANEWKADAFVSIHMNSFWDPKPNGIETYHMAGNAGGQRLATNVQNRLIQDTQAFNRGVKTANFVVLRETQMPAILIECGFISNPAEESKLRADWYQNIIAAAIGEGIKQYFGLVREDINKDGVVDIMDLAIMGRFYNSNDGAMIREKGVDLNGDGVVDLFDMSILSRKMR
jgi:N-acetylmuramoyl-L-alanine amidase CwlD